jgi:putative salt-induced outer membrane protein YdiY
MELRKHSEGATVLSVAVMVLLTLTAPPGFAQGGDRPEGWSGEVELTLVLTAGNTETSTLGFRSEVDRTWEDSALLIEMGAVRTESTTLTRKAIGASPSSFRIMKESAKVVTAEKFNGRGRYERNLNTRTFWYGNMGWERNTFAGVQNRYFGGGGAGNTWVDRERSLFKTTYGLSYTLQNDVVPVVGATNIFAGFQTSYDYQRKMTENTTFTSVLVADENLDELADLRVDLINAIAVGMTSRLALKVSWQVLYDRQPSLVGLPLIGSQGFLTGDTVFADLETFDNLLTFALVANF